MSESCLKCAVHDFGATHSGWDGVEAAVNRGVRNFGEFTLIDWFFDPMPDDYYGEFSQGHEGHLYMVFKHNESERHFRKTGEGDSYGNHTWGGAVTEVFPTRVEKIVYEYTYTKVED